MHFRFNLECLSPLGYSELMHGQFIRAFVNGSFEGKNQASEVSESCVRFGRGRAAQGWFFQIEMGCASLGFGR